MRFCKLLLVLCILIIAKTSSAQHGPQAPSLVAETTGVAPAFKGGTTKSFLITSAILNETRRVTILLPASYSLSAPERKYPVMVVPDGDFLMLPVATASDELSRNGQIPESVIVGIENTGPTASLDADHKRVYDLTPPGLSVSGSDLNQGGDNFLNFIENELLPAVDRQFRTSTPRFFVGISSGGVLATYAAATRSTYSAVIALDTPVHLSDNWLAKKLIARASISSTPVRYASLEAIFGWPEVPWKSLVAAAPASWRIYREKFQLEGHETMAMLGAYIGLRQVFSDFSRLSTRETLSTNILPYYYRVSDLLGARVVPPKRVLQDAMNSLIGEGRGVAARDAYNLLVFGYGAPLDSVSLIAKIAEAERRPPSTLTVESLLATAFPTPVEAQSFIGEWVGDISMGPNAPRTGNTTLRIKVVDGRVYGETIVRRNEGGDLTMKWDYFKITPQGINWGRLNERQPRAIMLFEGKLEGDTLYGKGQFAGIKLEDPPPPLNFQFKRVRK